MNPQKTRSFFDPLWRRVAIVGVAFAWTAIEWIAGETGWAAVAAAATIYGVWSLLYAWETGGKGPGTN